MRPAVFIGVIVAFILISCATSYEINDEDVDKLIGMLKRRGNEQERPDCEKEPEKCEKKQPPKIFKDLGITDIASFISKLPIEQVRQWLLTLAAILKGALRGLQEHVVEGTKIDLVEAKIKADEWIKQIKEELKEELGIDIELLPKIKKHLLEKKDFGERFEWDEEEVFRLFGGDDDEIVKSMELVVFVIMSIDNALDDIKGFGDNTPEEKIEIVGDILRNIIAVYRRFKKYEDVILAVGGCLKDKCQNGGICIGTTRPPACKCPLIYDGKLCEVCGCQNQGKCDNTAKPPKCVCPTEYIGDKCETLKPQGKREFRHLKHFLHGQ